MASHEHENAAAELEPDAVPCGVLTVSDSRTPETDGSGDAIVLRLERAGHPVASRDLVPDEPDRIEAALRRWIDDPAVAVILTTGGTGVGRRDTTVTVARRLIETELPGFGELFRGLSYEKIGAAAMLSGATAGLARPDTMLFCMPGATNAVELAMDALIVPQLRHLVWLRRAGG